MAIIKQTPSRRTIDCAGPAGNAWSLIGQAESFAKQLQYTAEQKAQLTQDLMSGDYDNLLLVFNEHFGSFCDLIVDDLTYTRTKSKTVYEEGDY